MTAKRFYIETYGCQMNEHDSEKLSGLLAHRGMVAVHSPEEADLFIINTCSVREKAAHKVYSRLGQFKARKERDRNFLIGVVGCVAQHESEEMVKKAPHVDLVVGTHLYHTIPDLLEGLSSRSPAHSVATGFLNSSVPVEFESVDRRSSFRANITVMEGCNKHCAFCIVPYTRGKERSRPSRTILEEARKAVDQGYVEILLLGQTVNSYRDPERPRKRFGDLLESMALLPGLRRLRFTSPHPREFDDQTISVIGGSDIICDQVHLPLQSGSSSVLRRMRRQHDREGFLSLIDRFRRTGRNIRFSTDVIVGFPGETEADFQQTMGLIETVQFESMFSFKYSPRPHTEAFLWPDDVPEPEKARRLALLQRSQHEIQLRLHRDRYLSRTFEILVEGTARDGVNRYGRTTTNKIVNFPGESSEGSFVPVRVTSTGSNSLFGRLLS